VAPPKKRSEVRLLENGGRAEDPQRAARLRQLARRLRTRGAPEAMVAQAPPWRLRAAWPFGALSVLEALWPRLSRAEVIAPQLAAPTVDWAVERALCARVANRAWAPRSKLSCDDQWRRDEVRMDGTESLALPHLSRALDVLAAHTDAIAPARDVRLADRLSREVELRFYDTTSRHVDIEAIDGGVGEADVVAGRPAAGAKTDQAPRQRGLSKNGRGDAPHIVVGLAVTRAGVPVRHGVFPGTTVDVTTGAQVKAALRGWPLSHWVVVGDPGMGSHEQLPTRSARGGKYLLGRPLRRGDAVTRAVFQRPGRDQRVADKRRVKEVGGGAGERRRRDRVCHPPQEETRPRAPRQARLRELAAELASLHEVRGAGPTKRGCELRASRRYGRYRRLTKAGLLRSDAAKQREEARLDGTFVVHRNDDSLTPADLALGSQQR
jgi:hypothetical protein